MSMIDREPSAETSITEWIRLTFSSSRHRCAEDRRPILMMSRSKSFEVTRLSPLKTLSVRGTAMTAPM
jgi:hypothetical protein